MKPFEPNTAAAPDLVLVARTAPPPPRQEPGVGARRLDPSRGDLFALRLDGFLAQHRAAPDPRLCGAVELIGFEPLKQRYGKRWPLIVDKVEQVAESCLERSLGPDDLYLPLGDELFVLLFAGLDRQQAAVRARLIASDMAGRLCGSSPGGGCVRVRALQLGLDEVLAAPRTPEGVGARVREADRPLEAAEDWRLLEERLRLVHWPIVNLRKRLVSIYRAQAVQRHGSPKPPPAAARGSAAETDLDLFALSAVTRVLPTLGGRGRKALAMVPLHYDTIAALRARAPYLALCRRLPAASSRRLLFELHGVPDDLPRLRVRELLAGILKPFGVGVVLRTSLVPAQLDRFAGTGVVAVAADVGGLDAGKRELRAALAAFAAAARRQRFASMLLDVGSIRLARLAREAGIAHLQGPALLPACEVAGRVVALSRRSRGTAAAPPRP